MVDSMNFTTCGRWGLETEHLQEVAGAGFAWGEDKDPSTNFSSPQFAGLNITIRPTTAAWATDLRPAERCSSLPLGEGGPLAVDEVNFG